MGRDTKYDLFGFFRVRRSFCLSQNKIDNFLVTKKLKKMSTELLLERDLEENRNTRFHRLFQSGIGYGINLLPYLDRDEKRALCATSFDMHNSVHRDKLGKMLSNYYKFPLDPNNCACTPYLENKMYLVEINGKIHKMSAVKNKVWEFSGVDLTDKMYIYIHKDRVEKVEQIDVDVDTADFFDEEQNFMDICDRNSYKCSNCLFLGCVTGITINVCIFQQFSSCSIQ